MNFWSLFKRNPSEKENPASLSQDPIQLQFEIFLSLITILAVVFFDQYSKDYFSKVLSINESLPVLRGIFHFTLVHNTGIAFGLFKSHNGLFIINGIIAFVLFALLLFNMYYYRSKDGYISKTYIIAFSLILGGAIGNLIDRIYFGYVIDFIDFRIWPVFNVADSAITIGALLILLKCIPSSAQ